MTVDYLDLIFFFFFKQSMESPWNLTILWLCHKYVVYTFYSRFWHIGLHKCETLLQVNPLEFQACVCAQTKGAEQLPAGQHAGPTDRKWLQHTSISQLCEEKIICPYLLCYKRIVESLLQHEFTVCSLFNHNTFLKSSNSVSSPNGRQSVSNHNSRTASPSLTEIQR